MDIAKFNSAFSAANLRRKTGEEVDVAAVQARLRAMIADEPEGEDRAWAEGLIELLAQPVAEPEPPSALYEEAAAIHATAWPVEGTVDEQLAALEGARHRIWAIAERAPADEAPAIRAMTRVLDHIEQQLRVSSRPAHDRPLGEG